MCYRLFYNLISFTGPSPWCWAGVFIHEIVFSLLTGWDWKERGGNHNLGQNLKKKNKTHKTLQVKKKKKEQLQTQDWSHALYRTYWISGFGSPVSVFFNNFPVTPMVLVLPHAHQEWLCLANTMSYLKKTRQHRVETPVNKSVCYCTIPRF